MNDNRCQFIKVQSVAYCETYGCTRRAAWAIGKPDGPQVKRHNLCDACARDLVEGMPEDLLIHLMPPPATASEFKTDVIVPQVDNIWGKNIEVEPLLIDDNTLPDDTAKSSSESETFASPVGSAPLKIFTCTACGEVFYSKHKRDDHRRGCKGPVPDKKGGRKK